MAKTGGFSRSILVWTHERGTLQYDIICALILAFIFFVPKSCFTARKNTAPAAPPVVQQQSPPVEQAAGAAKPDKKTR